MNWEDYRTHAKEVVDFIADYMQNIRDFRVFPDVRPGYMRQLLPEQAPSGGETWPKIMEDIKRLIMPGITHWQSPYMHAYYPALASPASLLGDMLSDAFNCLGFTWASSPACTELEVIVMDWLGAALNLPPFFLNKPSNGRGGGVIQTTASDATFVALLCARTTAIRRVANEQQQMFKVWQVKQQQLQQPQKQQPETDKNKVKSAEHALEAIANHEEQTNAIDQTKSTDELNESNSESGSSSNDSGDESPPMEEDSEINSRLVAYCSDQAHSSVEKASLVALVKLRYIESDSQHSMDCERLEQTIRLDRQLGLIPFFICATLGTTGCCAFDHLETIGTIAARHSCYVHVDAAYAGAAMICEEYRSLMAGIHLVHSFAFNPSKWLQVHFDCTALWVRDVNALHRTFNVNPLYLKHEQTGCAIDFMHWQVALSRRFRSLKLWCVLRNFGLEGLKKHVRTGVKRAELFELLLRSDPRFSVAAKRVLGLVVFRLNAGNELTELLLKRLNSQGKIHCVPASLKGTYVIRFTVTSANTTDDDIRRDFKVIQAMTTQVLIEQGVEEEEEEIVQHDVAEELDRIDVTHLPKRIESPSALKAKETVRNPKLSQLASSFGTSLLLCNSPMTPKLVNGSFAAILDNQDVVQEFVRKFGANCNWQRTAQTSGSTALRRRIKGLMLSDKQYSLDSRMDLVNSIMASINVESGGSSSMPNAEQLNRRSGSVREKRVRKQPQLHSIKKLEAEDKSSENSIQEEEEQQLSANDKSNTFVTSEGKR